jgi:hypothetical protein
VPQVVLKYAKIKLTQGIPAVKAKIPSFLGFAKKKGRGAKKKILYFGSLAKPGPKHDKNHMLAPCPCFSLKKPKPHFFEIRSIS